MVAEEEEEKETKRHLNVVFIGHVGKLASYCCFFSFKLIQVVARHMHEYNSQLCSMLCFLFDCSCHSMIFVDNM
jgi:hypothetical protein